MEMDKLAIPKENIVYLIVGFAVMLAGGGGADSPEVFNYALFSFTRMYIAPLLILIGFAIEIVVLLRKKPIKLLKRK